MDKYYRPKKPIEITYAIKYLQDKDAHLEKQRNKAFLNFFHSNEKMLQKYEVSYEKIFRVMKMIKNPSISMLFALQEKIHPLKWFYRLDEKLPELHYFQKEMCWETFFESDGAKETQQLCASIIPNAKKLAEFEKSHSIKLVPLFVSLFSKNPIGLRFLTIYNLKNEINPEKWMSNCY